jgi:hypothetical protein
MKRTDLRNDRGVSFRTWWLVALLWLMTLQPVLAAEAAGVVLAFSGKADIIHDGKSRAAAARAEFFSGDSIVTAEGQVQVRFSDGTLLTLYKNTRFAVDDYQYGKGKNDRAQFSLVNGLMHTVTGQMDKQNYQVKTRLANLGVRGTEYSAELGSQLQVSVDQGRVSLANAAGTIEIGAGSSAIVTSAKSIPRAVIGGKLGMGSGGPGGPGGGAGSPGGPGGGSGGAPPPPPAGTARF